MKLHHVMSYIFVNSLALGFIACSSQSATHMPPLPPDPTIPVTTEAPPAPSTTLPASCPQAGPGFVRCYDWGKCNGLFENIAAAVEFFKADSACLKVAQTVYKYGFGPCAECQAWTSARSMLMSKRSNPWSEAKAHVGTDHSKVYNVGDKVE
jgi:hypothetical protein